MITGKEYINILKKFLTENNLYPFEEPSWKFIEIEHPIKITTGKEMKQEKEKFREEIIAKFSAPKNNIDIKASGGLYVYKSSNDDRIIYIGIAKSLLKRIMDHYHESTLINENKLWSKFFSQFKGKLKLYVYEINDIHTQNKNSDKIINNDINTFRYLVEQSIELVIPSIFKEFTDLFISPSIKSKKFVWEQKHTDKLIEIINSKNVIS